MRKFLTKIAIVFISLVILLIILPFQFNNWVFNEELESKINYFLKDADTLDFIIAGESRARDNISPNVIKHELGLKTVNIAVNNCDLITIYNGLEKHNLLDKGYTYLISSSFFVQIDLGTRDPRRMSTASILNISFPDQLMFFGANYAFIFQNIIKGFFNELAFRMHLINYTIKNSLKKENGYVPQYGSASDSLIDYQLNNNPYFKDSEYDKKYDLVKETIKKFGSCNSTIILFQPPIVPDFYKKLSGLAPDLMEKEYCDMLRTEVSKYDNLFFLDFYNNPIDSLTKVYFHDIVHLTDKGAQIFSRAITEKLIEKGLIHKYNEPKN